MFLRHLSPVEPGECLVFQVVDQSVRRIKIPGGLLSFAMAVKVTSCSFIIRSSSAALVRREDFTP